MPPSGGHYFRTQEVLNICIIINSGVAKGGHWCMSPPRRRDMIVQYRVQQNQFLVILVQLRCFVVIWLTSFFVFNTVLCF